MPCEQRARTLFLKLSAPGLGGCDPHPCLFASWGVTLLGRVLRKGCTQSGHRDFFTYYPMCLCHSPSPPAQCDHTPTHDRSKEKWAVVLLGLTKGASDPERHHHLTEASSGLAGLTQHFRKSCTFPNQEGDTRLGVLGHPKRIKPFTYQRIHS